jgi:hypothetical protein
MAGLKTLLNKYSKKAEELAAERQKEALIISKDMYALVTRRLQNEGVDSKGNKFKLYSVGYKAKRRALGLPIDKRTHTFSGDMFKSTRPIIVEHNLNRTVVEIRANDRKNQDKLNENSKIVGTNILSLNHEEKNLLEELNLERIQKVMNK